jgi:hypothetical protein
MDPLTLCRTRGNPDDPAQVGGIGAAPRTNVGSGAEETGGRVKPLQPRGTNFDASP